MTVLTFPTSPTLGQRYDAPNQLQYVFDGVKWGVESVASTSLAVTNSVQDRVAPMFVAGPHTGIAFTYNAGTNVISAAVSSVNGNNLINGVRSLTLESNGNITAPAFTIPNATGTSGQVLKWPSSGTTLVWAADSGVIDRLTNGTNTVVLGSTGTLTLPNTGSIIDTAGSAGTTGIFISRTFQTPDNTNASNFGTNTIKLLLSDTEAAEIASYLTESIGVRVWFTVGDSYPITSCVQVSTGIWTITATGMGNRFATFTVTNPLIFIYTGSTPNAYQNFPEYVPVGDGANITVSKGVHDWAFGVDGALTLPSGYPILFGNGNSRIQAGMGFHVNSEEGISLEAVNATDPLLPVVHQWHFGTAGVLTDAGGSFTKTTTNNLATTVLTQIVWTATETFISGAKLTIQVEANETGGTGNWETQVCEAVIAVRGYNQSSVPVMSVYGVTHTSVAPLMTFSVDRNPVSNLVEIVGTRTATATTTGNASLRIYSVETGTMD